MGDGLADTAGADGDPGWRPAVKGAVLGLVPGLAFVRMRRGRAPRARDGLIALRSTFLGFVTQLGGVGIVVGFLAGGDGDRPSLSGGAGTVLVMLVGMASVLFVRYWPLPLVCRSDVTLAGSYRSRLFLRMAFAHMAALSGFAAFFLTANPAMYPLALVFAAAGYASLAPTATHLEADQQALADLGCARSLVAAVRFTNPGPN